MSFALINSNRLSLLAILLVMSSCTLFESDIVCTSSLVFGIGVEVTDSQTGEKVSDLWAFANDGAYADSFYVEPSSDGPALLAPERPGTYQVFVTKDGYQPWLSANVKVVEDQHGCHVEPVRLNARLERASSAEG